MAEHS